jgi:ABC-type arginine transport system ATPase subunit
MTPTLHRWGSVSAIAFAALVVAWFALAAVPDVMDAPERILDVYADDGVRARVFAGTVLLAFAGAFLLAFLADVCALLRAAERGPLADLALLGGAVFTTLLALAGALLTVLPVLIGFDELSATVDPDLAAVVVQLAVVVLLLFAPLAAATFVLAISIAALRQRLLAP